MKILTSEMYLITLNIDFMIDMVNIVCFVLLVGILLTSICFFYGNSPDDTDTF
jgi:hypothetical protein